MSNRKFEVAAIYIIVLIALTRYYLAAKGIPAYRSIGEFFIVVIAALIVATFISIAYLIYKRRKNS
jgi:hypothetical protein